MDPVHPDTHPVRIAQAARALRRQLKQDHDFLREETDPEKALTRLESLSDHVQVLASMIEAMALQAARAR